MSEEVRIDLVSDDDAVVLLTVLCAAFVSVAQSHGELNLPALTHLLSELQEDLQRRDVVTIGAWDGPRFIGSVRVGLDEDRAVLVRLAVAPDLEGQGVG